MDTEIRKIIIANETKMQSPDYRKSANLMNELLVDDFFEFGASGQMYCKDDILKHLKHESSFQISMTNIELTQLSEHVVLLTYKAKKTDTVTNLSSYSLRSSLWKKFGSDWKLVFHQGTPLPNNNLLEEQND